MKHRFIEDLEKAIQQIVSDEIDSRLDIEAFQLPPNDGEDRDRRKIQRVRNELMQKGYFLEIQVYKKLKERNWMSELNANYWDVETDPTTRPWGECHKDNLRCDLGKKIRTIDVLSKKSVNLESSESFTNVLTTLAIECKHSGRQNWAFFLESGLDLVETYDTEYTGPVGLWGSISYLDSLQVEQSYSGVDGVRHLPGCDERHDVIEQQKTIAKLNWASHHSPRALETAAISGVSLFGKPDSLYEATMQVLNASVHQKAFQEIFMFSERATKRTIFEFWRVYPVIVFDGPLWSYCIESGELVINPIEWITLYAKQKDREFAVDVVSLDSIDMYLDMIDHEIESMKKGGIDPYEKK